MNIKLTKEAMDRINELREAHKERGLKVKDWCQIISEIILEQKEEDLLKKIESATPQSFIIEKGLSDPELAQKIHQLILKSQKKNQKSVKQETI